MTHKYDPSYSSDRCVICRQPRSHPNHTRSMTMLTPLHGYIGRPSGPSDCEYGLWTKYELVYH